MNRFTWALLCLLLLGCGKDLPLPPAKALALPAAEIDAMYGAVPGPYAVVARRDISLATDSGDSLATSLFFPDEGQEFPLLLFSHGNWSDRHSYDRVIEHWVSHGYVVLAADHADCCSPVTGIFNSLRYGQLGLINRRVDDLNLLIDSVGELESRFPQFQGKTDLNNIAATGHSFGAFSAQQLGGASPLDPDSGQYDYQPDKRIRAVVALNPPGPMFDTITAQSWRGLEAPTLATTGTWDVQKGFWEDWRMHLMSFENSPADNKYALVMEGADHYLGNLICRTQRDHPPQEDALRILQIVTTAFLDAQLKGDREAGRTFGVGQLETRTNGFAKILQR
jgi:predicted dienelactone hydrolase